MAYAGPLVLVIVGLILLVGSMHLPIPAAAWIGLLLILHGSRLLPAVAAPPAVWLAAATILAIGERDSIPAPGAGYFVVVALAAFTLMLPFAIDRAAADRFTAARVGPTLVFPMAFVATEFLRSRVMPNATWGSIAYTQYGALPVMQIAAFTGIWGITFLMTWSASTFDLVWRHGLTTARPPVLAFSCVFVAAIVAGTARVATASPNGPTLRAVAINRPTDLFIPGEMTRITEGHVAAADRPYVDAKLAKLHDWFLAGTRREARAGARLVVWPEQNLLLFKDNEPGFLARAQRLAAEEHVYLAMGMGTIHLGEPRPFENKLVLIEPDGRIAISYLKTHPVPGWEASIIRRGDGRLPVAATPDGRMAAAICYDGSFPEFIREAADGGADLLILPVNDIKTVRVAHFQMHAFRAIETGIPIVRAAASGISGAFDPWGRVIAFSDYFAAGDHTMIVQLPIGGVRTIYARIGDALAWVSVGGVAVVLASLVIGAGLPFARHAFAVGAPFALAIVELFHPHPHDLLQVDLQRWMPVHYAQIALFPLAALAECTLVAGISGAAAALCRTAMFVFAASYIAFDAAAGIATGVLVQAARASTRPDLWRPAIQAIWDHAVIGGRSDAAPALAVIGTMAWLIGTLAAAVACWRAGRSWLVTSALVVSAFGLFVFRTHAWPGGPLSFTALALASLAALIHGRGAGIGQRPTT